MCGFGGTGQNDGEIDHVVDPLGYTTSYQYSDAYDGAYRTETTNALGQNVSANYDFDSGLETSFTDENNNTSNYNYDALDRLISVTDPDGGQTTYQYNPSGYPENSVLTTILMCGSGANCSAEESANQTETKLDVYDGFGRPSETELMSDPSGPIYTMTSYDALGNVGSVTNPYRSTSDPTYGSTTYQHDMLGRETELQHEPDGSIEQWNYSGNAVTFTDENGNQWQRTSDALGRLTQVLEPNGTSTTPTMQTSYSYDALGNLLSVTQLGNGSSGERLRTFTYDSLSRLLCASNPENSSAACPATATSSYTAGTTGYVYDADGNVTTKTSPAVDASSGSQTLGYCYDKLNRLQYKFYSGSFSCTSPSGYADAYTYDTSSMTAAANDVSHLTDEKAYVNGTLITERSPYQYDQMGRITAEQQIPYSPSGTAYQLLYGYDLAGNVTCANNGFASAPTSASPASTCASLGSQSSTIKDEYSYDTAGRFQWAKTSILPSTFAIGTYPPYLLEANESPSVIAYDPMGHLVDAGLAATSSSGGTNNISLSRVYNPRGHLTSESDTGVTASYATGSFTVTSSTGGEQYTGRSEGTFTFTGSEQSSGSTYDSGTWVAFVDPGEYQCTYSVSYGEYSTPASLASALAAGLNSSCSSLVTASASGGTVYVYSVATGSGADYALTSYLGGYNREDFSSPSFNLAGSTMTGGGSGGTYDSGTYTLVVEDQDETCAPSVSYGEGSTINSFAAAIASALNSSCSLLLSARASGGQVTVTATNPGTGSDYGLSPSLDIYDYETFSSPSFAITAQSMTGGGGGSQTPVYSWQASYDNVGNVTSYTDSVMGTWGFGYDTLNRLTNASAGANAPTGYANAYGCWSYDGFGNRTEEAYSSQTSTPCAAGADDNLQQTITNQSSGSNNQVAGYSYDDAGEVMNDNRNQYLYDPEGRVCAVASSVTGTWEYLYDAEGYRVGKVAESSLSCGVPASTPSHQYLLDLAGQQVTELVPSGSSMMPLHTNVFTGDGLLASYDFPDSGVHFALTDPLGTRRVQVDGAGVAELGFVSLPYGNDLNNTLVPDTISYSSAADATEQHFTQKERDEESGNDYFEARYYSSSIGRFLSPDWSAQAEPVPYSKLDDPQTLNLYSYVVNNPLASFDPDGHDTAALVGDQGPVATAFAETVEGIVGEEGAAEMGIADGNTLAAANINLQTQQQPAQQQGSQTSNGPFIAKDPQKYMGTCVGRGECVDFVKADTDVPRTTKDWAPGAKVDKDTPQGAAIATFGPDGKYQNIPGQSHAAELVSVAPDGRSAVIRDQYHTRGGQQVVHTRTIFDRGGHGLPVNDLSRYRVIMRRDDQ